MSIPIANPAIGSEERKRVDEVLESGYIADGDVVREFEDSFSTFCGVEHGVATSNGTTALEVAFRALGLGDGDTVLTTPFSFIASANAIRLCGATVEFADIDPETYTLDPDAIREKIEELDGSVDAILVVHLYGLAAPMDEISEIADEHDLLVIEDAAQAHGAMIGETKVGGLGDAACFSFYPTKNMTTGEGGMVVTDTDEVATRARRYINHGRVGTYKHSEVGNNFRMTNIAAAIGLAQLDRLSEFNAARRMNATALTATLREIDIGRPPVVPESHTHVYHQYTVWVENRDAFVSYLDDAGVGTGVYYPLPIHEQPAYDSYNGSFPHAESAAEHVVSLPVHPQLSESDLDRICTVLRAYGQLKASVTEELTPERLQTMQAETNTMED